MKETKWDESVIPKSRTSRVKKVEKEEDDSSLWYTLFCSENTVLQWLKPTGDLFFFLNSKCGGRQFLLCLSTL
jgi:hypothetical protein